MASRYGPETTVTAIGKGGNWSNHIPTAADNVIVDKVLPFPPIVGLGGFPGPAFANQLTIGDAGGPGALTVENGRTLNSAGPVFIGSAIGSTGTVTVTGPGATLADGLGLLVGSAGTGTLTIANGGTVTSANGQIGSAVGSNGTVTVTGAGSAWTTGAMFVGNNGTGMLTIADGGVVTTAAVVSEGLPLGTGRRR